MRAAILRSIAVLIAGAATVRAQSPVRVGGIAFDSLSGQRLGSAFIALGSRSTLSDSLGRFWFDSVVPGTYRLSMQHDLLDSLGLGGIATSVVVKDATDALRIA